MSVMRKMLFVGIFGVFFAECAVALDAKDIVNLKKNGVQDSTIVNMVRSNKLPRPLTPQEVLFLNGNGVSAPLLDFLTRPEASAIQPVSVPQASLPTAYSPPPVAVAPTVVSASACTPTPVYVQSPTYVVQSSPTYVMAPRYAHRPYYRSYGGRPYHFGVYYGRGGPWHRRGGPWGRW